MAFNSNGSILPVEPVQSAYKINTSGNPNVVFGNAPTTGNLIIAYLFQDITVDELNTTDWTLFAQCPTGNSVLGTLWALYSYVGDSPSATLPELSTVAVSSGDKVRAIALEVANVCGQWTHSGMDYRDGDFAQATASISNQTPIACPQVFSDMQLAILCEMNGGGRGTYMPGNGWTNLVHSDDFFPFESSGSVALDIHYFANYREQPSVQPQWQGNGPGSWIVTGVRSDGVARKPNGLPL